MNRSKFCLNFFGIPKNREHSTEDFYHEFSCANDLIAINLECSRMLLMRLVNAQNDTIYIYILHIVKANRF